MSRFHVDDLSSAHVYLRPPMVIILYILKQLSFVYIQNKGTKIDDIPLPVLVDCAQLVKANSIQGVFIGHSYRGSPITTCQSGLFVHCCISIVCVAK